MRKFWLIYSICVAIIGIWAGGFYTFVRHINSYNIDSSTETDAIIVLTGGKNRIAEGIRLLNENMAEKLFISGVPEDISIRDIENMAYIQADDENKIILGRRATNTIENASETVDWIIENNIKSIRLITSNYHIPRTLQEFGVYTAFGENLEVILHPVYSPNVNPKWWNSWGTFKLLVMEYNKFLIVYVWRHILKL